MAKDPIAALISFVKDIKPYHTKIIEVLEDYIYTDLMFVSFKETFSMTGTLEFGTTDETTHCPAGWGIPPWGAPYSISLEATVVGNITVNSNMLSIYNIITPNTVVVQGDQSSTISVGDISTITDSFFNDGSWIVENIFYDSTNDNTRLNVVNVTNQINLNVYGGYTTEQHPPGYIWVNPTNSTASEQLKFYTGGVWVSSSVLYPLNTDPQFIQGYTAPTGSNPVGSYWFNLNDNTLNQYVGGVWTTVSSSNYFVGTSNNELKANRNTFYIAGNVSNYIGPADSIEISNSVDNQNGAWYVRSACYNTKNTALQVQHITDSTVDGAIYTRITQPPTTPRWPSGLYWFDTLSNVSNPLKVWNGATWVVPSGTISVTDTTPVTAIVGDLWYKPTTNLLFKYTTTWDQIAATNYVFGLVPETNDFSPGFIFEGPKVVDWSFKFDLIGVEPLMSSFIPNEDFTNGLSSCKHAQMLPDPTAPGVVFVIDGDQLSAFTGKRNFIVQGSTGNDGVWQIVSLTYDPILKTTSIVASFNNISNISVDPTATSSEFTMKWNSDVGYSLTGSDLFLPMTKAVVTSFVISNFDEPQICSSTSSTGVTSIFKESYTMDVSLPTTTAPFNILGVNSLINPTIFIISGNQSRYFPVGAVFDITNSGSNDGLWTVQASQFNITTGNTEVIPVEPIPEFILPNGNVVFERFGLTEVITTGITENNIPPAWEFYYHAAPTTKIETIDGVTNSVVLKGDMRRFYPAGSVVTIQNSKNDTGSWNWTTTQTTYVQPTISHPEGQTFVKIFEPMIITAPYGTISSVPSWVRGIGWDTVGWSDENNYWLTITESNPLGGPGAVTIVNYDVGMENLGSYDETTFGEGGYGDSLQQSLQFPI
jgi:hypothetical protein